MVFQIARKCPYNSLLRQTAVICTESSACLILRVWIWFWHVSLDMCIKIVMYDFIYIYRLYIYTVLFVSLFVYHVRIDSCNYTVTILATYLCFSHSPGSTVAHGYAAAAAMHGFYWQGRSSRSMFHQCFIMVKWGFMIDVFFQDNWFIMASWRLRMFNSPHVIAFNSQRLVHNDQVMVCNGQMLMSSDQMLIYDGRMMVEHVQ